MATESFLKAFAPIHVVHLSRFGSDHAAISISLEDVSYGNTKWKVHLFRFEECWAKDERCDSLVQSMWSGSRSNRVSKIESIQSLDNEFAEYRTNEIRKKIAKT
jgi:hypothetical protein